jgi:hypothetical protein
LTGIPSLAKIPENRVAIDGKWDVEIGLWFEASHIHKSGDVGFLTEQTLLNLGADYTFGIGNGLNVSAEHLLIAFDEKAFEFAAKRHLTAVNMSYPLGLFDTLSTVMYQDWSTDNVTFFMNFEHQFRNLTGYVMAYYNPETQLGIQENELVNNNTGPGIRLMLVYNH